MNKTFFVLGTLMAAASVGLGAFGAHGLKGALDAAALANYETAARYQMYHAIALVVAAWAVERWPGALTTTAGWLFLAGIVLFCGSLYALSFTGIKWLGAITPLGGIAFIAGWVLLAVAVLRA